VTLLEIYAAFHADLRQYTLKIACNSAEADDLMQHSYLKACEHADELLDYPPQRVKAWLLKTARNALIDIRRKSARLTVLDAIAEPAYEQDLSRQFVEEMLGSLPENLQQVVILRHFEGHNSAEIAELLHIPAATVRTRLRTASILLKRKWAETQG